VSHILAISRYFPPLSSAGSSIRLVKFIKYASERGWQFSVVTQDPARPVVAEKESSGFLLDELPADTQIMHIGNPVFGTTIFHRILQMIFRQSSLLWGINVFLKSQERYNKQKPDLIFVNSPPFTNAAIGYGLATALHVPFVLDMKDDWIGSKEYQKKGKLRQAFDRWIERKIVEKADKVITVTPSSFESSTHRYAPLGQADKFAFIPNGEDLEEFHFLRTRTRRKEGINFHLLTSAAGYRPDYRDLTPLLSSLEIFIKNNPAARLSTEIEFVGEEIDVSFRDRLEKLLPPNQVIYTGILNRHELVERLWSADLLFLVQPRANSTAISGTLYEYWATGKAPVLLFSETGASSDVVLENKLGKHFHFDQIDEAAMYIDEVFKAFSSPHPIWVDLTRVEKFDRKEITRQMITIWSHVVNKTRRDDGIS
jgi:glycosyltransferase involved in cell wall biosynthesis